jgi:prepilin-type N-terminal cleavage/methylation domain-containing protein
MKSRAVRAVSHRLSAPDDAGITLIEVMIAIVIIGVVMTALTTFFTGTMTSSGYQTARQTASQLADAAIERARALSPTAITDGRDASTSSTQWSAPVAGVATYLSDMTMVSDPAAAAGSGDNAVTDPADPSRTIPALPTAAVPIELKNLNSTASAKGIVYSQNWYIGQCYQPKGGGTCGKVCVAGAVLMFKVVVAITWTGRGCASSACSFVTSTLISPESDPTFPAAGS